MPLGNHITINGNVYKSVLNFHINHPNTPIQIFAGSPKSYARKIGDYGDLKNYIIANDIRLYIHGAYVVNIGTPDNDKGNICVITDMINCQAMGAKGVVIHVGKYTTNSKELSLKAMIDNIRSIIEKADCDVKFLLETPAGQGTELLTKMEDFIDFSKKLKSEHADKFGIVCDTCHVFACGYDPLEYLVAVKNAGLIIDLVHLNDSVTEKGSCVDRHAGIGKGCIGLEKLKECMVFCDENNIDMINE
jgi:deoxyribonuclease-4